MQQSRANRENTSSERRAYPRCEPAIEVCELVPGKQAYKVQSVSAGGLSCWAEMKHLPGIMVVLEINLKNGLMPFSAPARVVRTEQMELGYQISFQFLMPQVQMIPYLSDS